MIFVDWFKLKPLTAGDWGFLFPEAMKAFAWQPVIRQDIYFGLDFYYQLTTKLASFLGFPWPLTERLFWFWPFLILTPFSSWYMAKRLFPKSKIIPWLAALIYLFNSYILMIVGGGQAGIFLSYAIAPLVLGLFINKKIIWLGLVLGIQGIFDPRLAMITLLVVLGLAFGEYQLEFKKYLKALFLPLLIALFFNLLWLWPTYFGQRVLFSGNLTQSGWLEFLSMSPFSYALCLQHPNWSENIFGKVNLLRPEFLIYPILAFSSLLFVKKTNKITLYFNLLAIIGAFLAKGTQPPFGFIYQWLFNNLPGMNLFRDPTKFYLLVALSYSILIPFSLERLSEKLDL